MAVNPPSATYREAFTHEEARTFAELWKDTPTHSPNPGGLFGKLARYILSLPPVPSERGLRPAEGHCLLQVPQQTPENPSPCAMAGHCIGVLPSALSAIGRIDVPNTSEILLACGEMKPRELRAVKAALAWFVGRLNGY